MAGQVLWLMGQGPALSRRNIRLVLTYVLEREGQIVGTGSFNGSVTKSEVAKVSLSFAVGLCLALLAFSTLSQDSQAQAQTNEIVEENQLPGDPQSEWDVEGAGDPDIQGFATDISVNQGQTVRFKVDTRASDYKLDIYRMGYYGGDGARLVDTVQPSAPLPQNQPDCERQPGVGLVDCGNWGVSASWSVPANAVSGIYFAKLEREDGTTGASHVVFVVRDDDGGSDMLFQTSDTTWQAYNTYGGYSLYQGSTSFPAGRASKVSYNRPFNTRAPNGGEGEDWVFNAEYPMVRWLERNGYDVSYFTNVDADRRGGEIQDHETFLSVGHDEYWSKAQRDNVEDARDAGVDLAFFSGNEVYWKTRWENSIDGSNTSHRTLVTYKEGNRGELTCGTKCDPTNVWTGLWRTGEEYDAGDPENSLTGQISWVGTTSNIEVPATDGKLRFWRNTDIANLQAGQRASLPPGTLGYEWDYEDPEYTEFYPDGRITMSETTRDGRTHKLSLYRDANGAGPDALVFGAGTVQWSWGLDNEHDRGGFGGDIPTPDERMQQATVNLFADMGVQPASLQSGLIQATASTDTTDPTSQITSPTNGASVQAGSVTVRGTAADAGAGEVGAVEVSINGGPWQTATGRENWSYTWRPNSEGQFTLRSRAVDDSGNVGAPSAAVNVTLEPRECQTADPCSIWDQPTPSNPNANDNQPIEVGVKFRSDAAGSITGLRFYKGAQNTGTHVGHLWSSTGQPLAEATFTNESASGWQEVVFDQPVPITADTTYVASYHSSTGGYAFDQNYFTSAVDNPPLRALANGEDGPNGLYKYGASGFPTATFEASNYWVDVLFVSEEEPPVDITDPTITQNKPTGKIRDRTPTISAVVRDERTNLAKEDIRLYVDGREKTGFTYNAATDRLTYDSGRLSYGAHTVEVRATDGTNDASKSWNFRIAKRR